MLSGTQHAPSEVVAKVPPNFGEATVEKIAINAVMAGCKPEYMPVVIAGVRAMCRDEFNLHGLQATTHSATPMFLVGGPVARRLGLRTGLGAFGSGERSNATIGRALKLIMQNLGGCRSGEIDRSAQGNLGQFSYCIAENTEDSPWDSYHVEQGHSARESFITVFAAESPHSWSDHGSRSAEQLVSCMGHTLATAWNHKAYPTFAMFIALGPEHADVLARDGWGKAEVRSWLVANIRRPLRELLPGPDGGESFVEMLAGPDPSEEILDTQIPKLMLAERIHIIVLGGRGGQFSSFIPGWLDGELGSTIVTEMIEDESVAT